MMDSSDDDNGFDSPKRKRPRRTITNEIKQVDLFGDSSSEEDDEEEDDNEKSKVIKKKITASTTTHIGSLAGKHDLPDTRSDNSDELVTGQEEEKPIDKKKKKKKTTCSNRKIKIKESKQTDSNDASSSFDTDSSDNELEEPCVQCSDESPGGKWCSCGGRLCPRCANQEVLEGINDWMILSTTCDECDKRCCTECAEACFSCCANDVAETYCHECKPKLTAICTIHHWKVCEKHREDTCGECYRNKRASTLAYGFGIYDSNKK